MRQKLAFVFVTIMWAAATVLAAPAPTRLAVLPTAPELAAQADLLTVGLSTRQGIGLLEREQIQRIWQEQELAKAQRPNFVNVGRLLNADGVLALERRIEGTNEMLAVRLVAVRPGIVLAEHRFVLPLTEPTQWGESFAAQVERLLPKLNVKPADAVAISLLNLRSSLASAESVALEQELTTLLQFRLTRELAIFILERRRIEELKDEKLLAEGDTEPFWNGAWVLDGVINRDTVSRDTITIHTRLTPPRGTSVEFEVSGRRDALGGLVDELARKVLTSVNKVATLEVWRPEREAERYFEEAAWAWRWQVWRATAEAADASWALGRHTKEVAALRVVSRACSAFSRRGPLAYESVGDYGFRPPPAPETLSELIRALEIYRDAFLEFSAGTNRPGASWASVGLDVSRAAARVLDRYHEQVEFCQGHEEDLRRVREMAREVNQLMSTSPGLGLTGWRRDLRGLPAFTAGWKDGPLASLGDAWLEAGGVWFEKAADAVAQYRRLLDPSVYPFVRSRLLGARIPLAAWSVEERRRLSETWLGFAREMIASTNPQVRLDGMRVILAQSLDSDELDATARRFMEETWNERSAIARLQLDAPVEQVLNALVRRVGTWGRPALEPLEALAVDWRRRLNEADPGMAYQEWKDLLSRLTNKVSGSFVIQRPSLRLRPAQAKELIAEFEAAERRGLGSTLLVRQFLADLKDSLSQPAEAVPAVLPAASGARSEAEVSRLKVSQRWSLEAVELPTGRRFGWTPRARKMVWQRERLWMETATFPANIGGASTKPALVALDPRTMRAELFEVPFESFDTPLTPRWSLIAGDELYASGADSLWRRDPRGEWHRVPLPAPGWAPCLWGTRIVLTTDHSILEVDPQTTQTRILASNRRNPPVTALDRVGLGQMQLAVWPGDRLCAAVAGKVWAYDPARKDWSAVLAATNCGERLELLSVGAVFRQTGQCGPRMLGGWHSGSSVLDYFTWDPIRPLGRGTQPANYTPPLWTHPLDSCPHACAVTFEGPNVWVFPMPVGEMSFEPTPAKIDHLGRLVQPARTNVPSNLLYLDRRFVRALEVGLELTGPNESLTKTYDGLRRGWGLGMEFIPTPAGLAVLITDGGVLLWAPRSDVDRVLSEASQGNPQPERFGYAHMRRFDRNQDGWLDDSERRTMRRDPGWRRDQAALVEAAVRAVISQHSASWDTVFTNADKNRDGKLSSFELAAAATNNPAVFVERLRGVNGSLAQAMRPYDRDSDMMYDRGEFRSFLGDPRLLAEVNRSADWVAQFGLKPEECDPNDDGVLDNSERLLANRLIRERSGGRGGRED